MGIFPEDLWTDDEKKYIESIKLNEIIEREMKCKAEITCRVCTDSGILHVSFLRDIYCPYCELGKKMNLEEFWKQEREKMAQLTCTCVDICCSPLSPNCRAKNTKSCFPPLSEQEKKMSNPHCGDTCPYCEFQRQPYPRAYSRLNTQGKFRSYVRELYSNHSQSQSYNPQDIAKLYGWPTGITGPVFPIYLIELGGGYNLTNITNFFKSINLPVPNVSAVSVDGATNSYSSDPNGPSVEVELDVCCAAGIYSYMTGKPANIIVVFAPNSDTGFSDAVGKVAALGNGVGSISWGGPESSYSRSTIQTMDTNFYKGTQNGITWTAASGDNLAQDGTNSLVTDYPACSPWVLSCGGTTLNSSNGVITNESVWNSDGGGTGGGFSSIEAKPTWQNNIVPGNWRGSPDITGCADPNTGWNCTFGSVGGTSAVAPAYAGYLCALYAKVGKCLGNVAPALYANESTIRDILTGNNSGYTAGPNWDAASGLGVLTAFTFNALSGDGPVSPTPPPVNPTPPPAQPIPPTPTEPTLQEVVAQINATCFQTEKQVARIFARFTEYLRVKIESDLQTLYAKKGNWFNNKGE